MKTNKAQFPGCIQCKVHAENITPRTIEKHVVHRKIFGLKSMPEIDGIDFMEWTMAQFQIDHFTFLFGNWLCVEKINDIGPRFRLGQ